MKKYKYLFLTIILIIFIFNIKLVILSTKDASILFFNKVFVSIFPFIILCDILIYFDYHIFLKNTIGKFISKLFNIDSSTSIIFILSILTSHPANSVYIKDMLDNNEIDIETANKILCFTYFPSISFVIGTIGISLYNNFKIGLILYLFCFLNNILIGIYLRKNKVSVIKNKIIKKNQSIFDVIKKSILKGINTSFIILGNLIIFTIISNLLNKYININPVILSIISGILELTNGIVSTSFLNINLIIKLLITLFILCFSGLSIIFQSISILGDYKINIKKILTIKLVFSILTCILFITFYYFVNNILYFCYIF